MPIPAVLLNAAQQVFDEANASVEKSANVRVVFNAKLFKVRCHIENRADGGIDKVRIEFFNREN